MPDTERKDRKEILVTISVAALIVDISGNNLLLVRNRVTNQWGLPAGGLAETKSGQLETVDQAIARELREETGLNVNNPEHWWGRGPTITGIVNLRGVRKYSLGVIYAAALPHYIADGQPKFSPEDLAEIEEVRIFRGEEIADLLTKKDQIYKPEFNMQILKWWFFKDNYDSLLDETASSGPLNEQTINKV